jgi:hypothetical protein
MKKSVLPRKSALALSLCTLVGLLAVLIAGAVPAGASTPKGPRWYRCEAGGSKEYSDNACNHLVPSGTGAFGQSILEPGKLTSTTLKGTNRSKGEFSGMKLTWTLGGINWELTCGSVGGPGKPNSSVNGSVENPGSLAGHEAGIGAGNIRLTGCELLTNGHEFCKVREPFEMTLRGYASEVAGVPDFTFEPWTGGANLGAFTLENNGAEMCFANGTTIPVGGYFVGTQAEAGLEVTPATSFVHIGSAKVSVTSILRFETSAGERLRLVP